MDTREQIKEFGEGKDYFFYPWSGRMGNNPFPILPEYQIEGTGPNGSGISGPPRATIEEAEADRVRMLIDPNWTDKDMTGWSWRVTKNECYLKISVAKEL